jgi:hypothetical protein
VRMKEKWTDGDVTLMARQLHPAIFLIGFEAPKAPARAEHSRRRGDDEYQRVTLTRFFFVLYNLLPDGALLPVLLQ